MALAVAALAEREVGRIILTRPAVEAGERLGFLPGDLLAKVDPYLRPLYDALYDMLDADRLTAYMEKGAIEVAPLAFMRGRTLNDSFIILDEAQNTSPEQMQMFLTRLGFGSKVVVTGDVTQIDLPRDQASGLISVAEHPRLDRRDRVRRRSATRTSSGTSSSSGSSRRTGRTPRRRGRSADGSRCRWSRSRSPTGAASRSTRRPPPSSPARVLAAEGIDDGELGIAFVGPDESRALKREHLGIDEATDVLSFPIDGRDELPPGPAAAARRRRPLPAGRRRRLAPPARARAAPPARLRPRAGDGSARGGAARAMSTQRVSLRERLRRSRGGNGAGSLLPGTGHGRRRISLVESFNYAVEGIIHVLRTHRNMRIHFAAAVVVLVLALGSASTGSS